MSEITTQNQANAELLIRFNEVRAQTLRLCETLETEDFVVQPTMDVSPPKWHLAHTTWFFEVFVLVPHAKDYKLYHPDYPYLFNSYYVAAGERWTRAERGHLTRPTVQEVMRYRQYVEQQMQQFLAKNEVNAELQYVLEIGLQHEQQHQELLLYDIKYILGHNPLFPEYRRVNQLPKQKAVSNDWLQVGEGTYDIGHRSDGFSFDNEHGRHKVFLHAFKIASGLVTNGEYMEFMMQGGYENPSYWLSDGWDWLSNQPVKAPMYWFNENGDWFHYTLSGFEKVDVNAPVMHVSFYEADAFARWKGVRLPTEFEWEIAASIHEPDILRSANFVEEEYFKPVATAHYSFFGNVWEWTSSAYLPYPFYKAPGGALGEYNGKFMVNQKVLRGGSFATPRNHIRLTYRNFFHPHLKWLFSGIRLAKHL